MHALGLLASCLLLFSCNKDLAKPVPTPYVPPAGSTIMSLLDGANFTLLKAAVTRAGLNTALNTPTNVFTVFAPDDAAFAASGISLPVINGLPVATLTSILQYHLIGGQRLAAASIRDQFPNNQMQSMLMIAPPSAQLPPGYRMPLSISRRGTAAWANQIPVKQADVQASNGVIHVVAGMLAPPDSVLAQIMAVDPSYSYLMAAVARADAGPPPGAPQLAPLLANALANFTVFAPTNEAFIAAYTALGLGAAGPITPQSVNLLPSATVWGIVAYHVQGFRTFSVNLAQGASTINSILGGPPTAPPQIFNVTGAGVQVRGPGNVIPGTTTPYSANVTVANKHAINGVIHRVDAVLLPQ